MNNQMYDDCKCNECDLKFRCGTQERYFSDINLQGLYEAMMASGKTSEEALVSIIDYLKGQLSLKSYIPNDTGNIKWGPYHDHTVPPYYIWHKTTDNTVDPSVVTVAPTMGTSKTYTIQDKGYEVWTDNNEVKGYRWTT